MPPQPKSKISRRKFLTYGGTISGLAMLAGCASSDEGGTPTETSPADGGGDKNSEFGYGTIVAPSSIDPMKATDELESILAHTAYDPLLYYKYEFPSKVIPWLATDWTVSEDNKTYTFTLRDDVAFHNGDKMTAEDVVFSVNRMLTMQQGPAWMWSGVLDPKNVKAINDTTVEITTNKAYAPFLATLPWMYIVNKNQIIPHEKDGNFGKHGDYGTGWLETHDAGSGPYTLTGRKQKTSLSYEKSDNWWGEFADGNVYKTLKMALTAEVATIKGKIKNGQLDMTDGWLSYSTYKTLASHPEIKVSSETTLAPFYVFMNNQIKPFDDTHVRKALSYAFDYKTVTEQVLPGATQLAGPLPRGFKQYHADDVLVYNFDREKAKQHLQQSKYAPEEIDITYTYVSGLTAEKNLGLLMQSKFQPLGINFKIQKAPWTKIVSQSQNVETSPQMFPLWSLVQYLDPDSIMYGTFHSSKADTYINGSKYMNDHVDSLLEQARHTLDKNKRAQYYKEIQRIVADDAVAIYAVNDVTRWAMRKSVQGFVDTGINGYCHQFQHLYKA